MKYSRLKELISRHGKEKINSATKYPSILTLHEMGDRGVLLDELTTPIAGKKLFATEKIDGTNARIICFGSEFLIGSRDSILHFSGDLYYDQSQGIVDGLYRHCGRLPDTRFLTVIYGEFFGGKTSANSKWYGKESTGFKVFDVAVFNDLSVFDMSLPEISLWRERRTEKGMVYGQDFLSAYAMRYNFPMFDFVPDVRFQVGDCSHETILANLKRCLPETLAALSKDATKNAEGIILRTADREKIVKIRFEDYERTLRMKNQ
jgi:hypothetical protein